MDAYEATKTVMSRIQALDPDNSSKIMGFILIQDQGDKEMIRLAFSPDAILLSYINRAKARLGLTPNPRFPQIPPPRILIPSNGAAGGGGFHLRRPRPVTYEHLNIPGSPGFHFYGDEYQLSSPGLDPMISPGGMCDSPAFPYGEDASSGGGGVSSPHHPSPFHKRSCSVNDAAFLEDGGCGMLRHCMCFSRGDDEGFGSIDVSPGERFDELVRMKALKQQRFAAMGGHNPFAYNRCMDLLSDNLRFKPDRGDLSPLGLSASANSVAHQIYLTFPAESTFKEEDVTNYFGMFGPVQDVRIPYQQKRMFGFVTFVYPETVKLILSKGNPHFVCDSRVLVKPYKEKGKFKEKKQYQCLSPSGVDGEHMDTPYGPRMLLSPRDMMLRRKLEREAEMQHAIELEGRRMMNLQLMDPNNENHDYRYLHGLPAGTPYFSSLHSEIPMNRHLSSSSDSINLENPEEFDGGKDSSVGDDDKKFPEGIEFSAKNNMDFGNKLHRGNSDDSDVHESFLETNLPDNLFPSPTKSAAENQSVKIATSSSSNDPHLPGSSPLTLASLKSCYLQMPSFSSGQEAIEM